MIYAYWVARRLPQLGIAGSYVASYCYGLVCVASLLSIVTVFAWGRATSYLVQNR